MLVLLERSDTVDTDEAGAIVFGLFTVRAAVTVLECSDEEFEPLLTGGVTFKVEHLAAVLDIFVTGADCDTKVTIATEDTDDTSTTALVVFGQ